jgi:two-component system, OmpR family, phosphate regulon sensor histidine kinase PhoR
MQTTAAPIQNRLYRDTAIVLVFAGLALWLAGGWHLREHIIPETQAELKHQGKLALLSLTPESPQISCERIAALSGSRFSWLSADGDVLGDSSFGPSSALPLNRYPEVQDAIAGKPGHALRFDSGSGQRELFVALPITDADRVVGVLRLARPIPSRSAVVFGRCVEFLVAAGAALLVLLVLRLKHLAQLRDAAQTLANAFKTQPGKRLPGSDILELEAVSLAANRVVKNLKKADAAAERRDVEWAAVFNVMHEGILLIEDSDELRLLNPAAADFFNIADVQEVLGRLYLEVIRNADLHDYVETLRNNREHNGGIELHLRSPGGQSRDIFLSGTRICKREDHADAVLLVMNDVTRLKKLQGMREQFAGNVSHELKTPLTSMKGYIELLADSANDEPLAPCIDAISRQSTRMLAIIEDLLYLSRIEHSDPDFEHDFAAVGVKSVLASCIAARQADAEVRQIALELDASGDQTIVGNERLLAHAIDNLIANAIRHSPERGSVRVSATSNAQHLRLEFADSGPGIPAEHHRTIFQRFFRLDKGRDRDSGGTGLGLAIVKHVVYLHQGRVWVESTPGEGSRFIIELPKKS